LSVGAEGEGGSAVALGDPGGDAAQCVGAHVRGDAGTAPERGVGDGFGDVALGEVLCDEQAAGRVGEEVDDSAAGEGRGDVGDGADEVADGAGSAPASTTPSVTRSEMAESERSTPVAANRDNGTPETSTRTAPSTRSG
jgi:hypothetical protein